MSDSTLSHKLPANSPGAPAARGKGLFRAAAKKARRTGRPQQVRLDEYTEWFFPIRYCPHERAHNERRRREWEEAQRFLHRVICAPSEWWRIASWWEPILRESRKNDPQGECLIQIADLKPGEEMPRHEPDECPGYIWRGLAKEYLNLRWMLAAAAGRLPSRARRWRWPGCVVVSTPSTTTRRGRPPLKRPFYDLAAEFVAVARMEGEQAPRGFYTALARYLSFPEYGIRFTGGELREAVRSWYARSPGISPAERVFAPYLTPNFLTIFGAAFLPVRCSRAMDAYDDPEALLKLAYVAELVGVSTHYLQTQIRIGRLGAYRIGRQWRVSRKQLEQWLRMVESPCKVA